MRSCAGHKNARDSLGEPLCLRAYGQHLNLVLGLPGDVGLHLVAVWELHRIGMPGVRSNLIFLCRPWTPCCSEVRLLTSCKGVPIY